MKKISLVIILCLMMIINVIPFKVYGEESQEETIEATNEESVESVDDVTSNENSDEVTVEAETSEYKEEESKDIDTSMQDDNNTLETTNESQEDSNDNEESKDTTETDDDILNEEVTEEVIPAICEIKIRYVVASLSEDKTQTVYVDIYPTYHIQLAYGETYERQSPEVEDYILINEEDEIISGQAALASQEILVIYKELANIAKYTVNYWTMDIDGSNATKVESLCYVDYGEIGTTVTVKLPSIPGYSWSNDDLLIYITADGNAVKNVYYTKSDKRKLVFRTGTGYAKVVEAYPGEEITEERNAIRNSNPTKQGYKFVGWDTSIEDLEEQVIYNEDGTIQKTYSCYVSAENSEDGKDHYYMPTHDYIIQAIWAEDIVKYRVVYWFENADGNGYENEGLDEIRYGLTGNVATSNYFDRLIADEKTLFGANYIDGEFVGLKNDVIQDIDIDENGNPYNFEEIIKDKDGNEILDDNGDPYKNTFKNYQGTSYTDYKKIAFFGFDYDHCDDVVINANGHSTLNIYYKREIWTLTIYNEQYEGNDSIYTEYRVVKGRYDSIIPKENTNDSEEEKFNKLPTHDSAKAYYESIKPSDELVYLYINDKNKTRYNLTSVVIFADEDANGLHAYSLYPDYDYSISSTCNRYFYGAKLDIQDGSTNLDDYDLFAALSSPNTQGSTQEKFAFDKTRHRGYTFIGAQYRYRSYPAGTTLDQMKDDDWSKWITIDTSHVYTNDSAYDESQKLSEGQIAFYYLDNGAIRYRYNVPSTNGVKNDAYIEILLPRKELEINFISNNKIIKLKN